jgi:hypothetical protein
MSSLSRKARRARKKQEADDRPNCSFEGCSKNSIVTYECKTCEKLKVLRKVKEVYTVHACALHQEQVIGSMKKHALTKHPSNLLRAVAAQLKGEEVW